MGLDGFSMGNLGLNANMTSAQMAAQVEHLAQKESEIKIKDVNEMAQDQGINRKKEQSENQNQFKDNKKESDQNDEDEVNNKIFNKLSEKDFENKDPREFSVRINNETDMIELFSNKEGKVLETISANDLMKVISKLSNASGVLVNRKI